MSWICPNCGWTKYSISYIEAYNKKYKKFDILQDRHIKRLCICDKCSLVFSDPNKFNLVINLNYDLQSIIENIIKDGYKESLVIEKIGLKIEEFLKEDKNERKK